MSLAEALCSYITLNFIVTIAFFALLLLDYITKFSTTQISSRSELLLHYLILSLIFFMVLVHPFIPVHSTFHPVAKIWSAESIKRFYADRVHPSGFLAFSASHASFVVGAGKIKLIWEIIASVVLGIGGIKLAFVLRALNRIRKSSYLVRKIGKISLFVSDEIKIPFSYYFFGANVVLPSNLLSKREQFRICVTHELQHHRQRDTLWVYGIWSLRLICAPNPFIHLWNHLLTEKQEFACDEILVGQKKIKSQAYASCLVEVAQTVVSPIRTPVCATGLTFLTSPHLLKRRITKMLTQTPKEGRSIVCAFAAFVALIMAASAYASKSLVQDERITMSQARQMAHVDNTDNFPIVVNQSVLKELNRYMATPDGRSFIEGALAHMKNYAPEIRAYTARYHLPPELMAVPLVESGYQNLTQAQSDTPEHAAGLWQFIPKTARNFGLIVNANNDQRLNVRAETDAAMRLLKLNDLRFNDWQLAVLAYNAGDKTVQQGINKTGSRNTWTLVRAGYQGDKGYLARVMAAILIINNPKSFE